MRPTAVNLDCADPLALADFYHRATGLPLHERSDREFAGVGGGDGGLLLGFQRVDGHRPPTWPGRDVPQQLHLDFDVDDLDEAVARLVGGVRPYPSPSPGPTCGGCSWTRRGTRSASRPGSGGAALDRGR